MVNDISFPGLFDHVFHIDRVAFTLFGKDVMWYGVILAFCFVAAAFYVLRRCPDFGWSPDRFLDMILWGLPAGIIGCRVYFVMNRWDYYSAHPSEIIEIWNGGLGMYGGVIAAVLVVLIFCSIKHCDILSACDLAGMGFMLAQCIGRWANFINAEAHGGETSLPWGMSINGAAPVHPTFLYESLWTLAGFLFLHFYSKRRKFRGELALMYAGWYGMIRFLLEYLRTDSLFIGHTGLKASQMIGLFCVIVSAALLAYFYISKKYPRPFVPKTAVAGSAASAPAPEESSEVSAPEDSTEAPEAPPQQKEE